MELINIYKTFHSEAAEYTFFSSAHGTSSRTDLTPGHRTSLSKFNKSDITSSILSKHNTMRLEINYKKKPCKKYKHEEAKQYSIGLAKKFIRVFHVTEKPE